MKKLLIALAALGVVAAMQLDYADMIDQQRADCDMVELWEQDADQGIHPLQRRGWPAKDDNELQECKQLWQQ